MITSLRLLLLAIIMYHHDNKVRAMDETAGVQETSDAYLRNVVQELQLLNGIMPSASSSSLTDQDISGSQHSYVYESPTPPPIPSAPSAPVRFVEPLVERQHPITSKFELHPQVVPKNPTYLEEPSARQPLVLGFTPAELASMYRKAIERGTPMRYGTLVNAVSHQQPKIITTPLEITPSYHNVRPSTVQPGESQYAYYFYPLQSFRHELMNNYGYKTMPDNIRYDSAPAENTKKETSTMNPILVGISSFLGMALFFMITMFLYPRFIHYMHFPFVTTSARMDWQDELAHLAAFATDAIDYYNKNLREKPKRSPYVVQKKKFQKRHRR